MIPTLFLAYAGTGMFMLAAGLHIAAVGVAGALAVAASVAMSIIAMRRNDVHALWLGMGFSVMATLLVIHALATPGIFLPANGLVQIAGALNLPIGGTILAASGLSVLRRPRHIKLLLGLQLAVVGELALIGGLILVSAPVIPFVPFPVLDRGQRDHNICGCGCCRRRRPSRARRCRRLFRGSPALMSFRGPPKA